MCLTDGSCGVAAVGAAIQALSRFQLQAGLRTCLAIILSIVGAEFTPTETTPMDEHIPLGMEMVTLFASRRG